MDNISFVLHKNEKLAIVGENGSGKTTLIKLLLRFYDPQQGQILFNNTDIRVFKVESWKKIISAVFQNHAKYALSVGENISIFDQEDGYIEYLGIKKILKKNYAHFDSMLKREFGGIEFSGGS